MNGDFFISKINPNARLTEQYQLALQELNALQQDLQKEYHRLLELLSQGYIETVLQIISHQKALNSIKN